MLNPTFIIDCPWCKAKVAALEAGRAETTSFDDYAEAPSGARLYVGSCPTCHSLLAGEATQVSFNGWEGDTQDAWSDVVRIYPKPPRTFSSYRIPRVVIDSLTEADRSLQANANIAACAMLGRALEAVCRDILDPSPTVDIFASPPLPTPQSVPPESPVRKKIMLAEGIRRMKDQNVIDQRLYDWSQQLHAFRNLAAHAEDTLISRQDAEDLQTFVYAIVEYIYDLTDRYNEFKARVDRRPKQ